VQVIGLAFSLVPQLLFVLLIVGGLVVLAQRGDGQSWARLAQLGLVLMLVGSVGNLAVSGGLASGAVRPFRIGALYALVGLLTSFLHWAGIGLLVVAVLNGRRASQPVPQLPE